MLTITSMNVDEIMKAVGREMRQLPVLRAQNEQHEDDLVTLFTVIEAHDAVTALPRELAFRLRELRESHAKRMRSKLSGVG